MLLPLINIHLMASMSSSMFSLILHFIIIPLFNVEFCVLLFYILTNLLVFFGDTYLCQEIVTEKSEGLVFSYYETDFVGADIRFQKALVLLMTRAQKHIIFSIGNFAPLSMGTIVTVVKASVSYFMLLYNLRRD
ncbi:hypothetical protein RI129_004635 [Pyrocoelia pectoralis]|uniref:Uncharacterized protein n=1 Tax=Pyrocoelia pectoralis TaxID=417401 RepID=A0AAN7VJN4_9COLE